MKRTYFLVAIASLQILLGSFTLLAAAQPVRVFQDAPVSSGTYYQFEFGLLLPGQVSGNLSEDQGRSFDFFVFDDAGFAVFRDTSDTSHALFAKSGSTIPFDLNLPGPGQYHAVAVDLPNRGELRVHVDLVVVGLKPSETIVALIVLVGGLALLAATLMLSVWAWRRALAAPVPSPAPDNLPADLPVDPPAEPLADPAPDPQDPLPKPADDNTRIY